MVLFSILACHRDKPGKDHISPENLVSVLVDLHLVYAIQSEPNFREISLHSDSVDTYTYVFDKYNVTRPEFDSTISWYSHHPKLFTGIYDKVIMQLTRLSDSLNPDQER